MFHSHWIAMDMASHAGLMMLFHAALIPQERRFQAISRGARMTVPMMPMVVEMTVHIRSRTGFSTLFHAVWIPCHSRSQPSRMLCHTSPMTSPSQEKTGPKVPLIHSHTPFRTSMKPSQTF